MQLNILQNKIALIKFSVNTAKESLCSKMECFMAPRTIKRRISEHQRALHQPQKSAVARHTMEEGHIIHFGSTKVRISDYYN